ncbi:MAG: hypothetical protein NC911_08135 [Candidatus Omnitrophica bacterium]|nr:hypothetical protein [Candidatus Omnitrophota bacterium]
MESISSASKKAESGATDRLVVASLLSFARAAGVMGIIAGATILLGWSYPLSPIQNILRYLELIRADTALALLMTGTGLWFATRQSSARSTNSVVLICSLGVILTGILPLLEAIGQVNIINRLMLGLSSIFGEAARTEKMALVTASYIFLLGISLFLLRNEAWAGSAQVIAWLAIVIALVNFLGYSPGRQESNFLSQTQPDLLVTSAFIILGFGLIFSRPEKGIMTVVSRAGFAGTVARRLLPLAMAIPFVLRWLIAWATTARYISGAESLTLMAIATITVFCFLTWWNAKTLFLLENERLKTEVQLEETNQRLSTLVTRLESRSRQNTFLSEMRDLLQACSLVEETEPIIANSMEKILPGVRGSLFLFSLFRHISSSFTSTAMFFGFFV